MKRRFAEWSLRRLDFPVGDDNIRSFAEQIVTPLLPTIRANHDAHVDISDPDLAHIVAIDFLFLVKLLLQSNDRTLLN
ncbi:unnamed protein product [Linum trigynum]|uniref:Uncharacterized protein n=1 Tax=Linum trigynum TaxID=586398 RepID=A0AAV2CMI8_9ROSI